jgi:hypothetical protein
MASKKYKVRFFKGAFYGQTRFPDRLYAVIPRGKVVHDKNI